MYEEEDDFDEFMLFEAPMLLDDEEDSCDYAEPLEERSGCEQVAIAAVIILMVLFSLMIMCSG